MHTQLGLQKRQQTVLDISLVMATTALLVSTAAVAAAAGGVLPFAIALEEQASLGEEQEESRMLAFTSTRDGNLEVYVMNADGSEQTRLKTDPGYEDRSDWGPAADTDP